MKKKFLFFLFFLLSHLAFGEARSISFNGNWVSDVQFPSVNELKFVYTCSVDPLDHGIYEAEILWNLYSTGDVFNIQVPTGATYVVALDSFQVWGIWAQPGSSFSISYVVPATYEPIRGTITSIGFIPGPDLVDWGATDQDQILIPAPLGGVIPEPTTMLLVGTGIVGLLGLYRVKKRK